VKRLIAVLALAGWVAGASAATKAERCAKYNEELVQIEEAK
jgi:hypothetical protein